jgi:hypothetical protein
LRGGQVKGPGVVGEIFLEQDVGRIEVRERIGALRSAPFPYLYGGAHVI